MLKKGKQVPKEATTIQTRNSMVDRSKIFEHVP
jgi:hypothetical protein